MEGPDVDCGVTEHAEDTTGQALIVKGEGGTHRDWDLTSHDAPSAEEVALDIQKVHRPASPVRLTGLLAKELSHDVACRTAHRKRQAVIAVRTEDIVVRGEAPSCARNGCLLADVEVAVSADAVACVLLLGSLLEAPYLDHHPVEPMKLLSGDVCLGGSARRRGRAHMLSVPHMNEISRTARGFAGALVASGT